MNLQSISRYISLILRHKPEVINITLNEHGWANVEKLIQGIAKKQSRIQQRNFRGNCTD